MSWRWVSAGIVIYKVYVIKEFLFFLPRFKRKMKRTKDFLCHMTNNFGSRRNCHSNELLMKSNRQLDRQSDSCLARRVNTSHRHSNMIRTVPLSARPMNDPPSEQLKKNSSNSTVFSSLLLFSHFFCGLLFIALPIFGLKTTTAK